MKKLYFALALLMAGTAYSQTSKRCGTEQLSDDQLTPNQRIQKMVARQNYERRIEEIKSGKRSQKSAEFVYKIPVVFHLMTWNQGPLFDDFVNNRQKYINAVEDINRAYRNADSNLIQAPFDQISPNVHIEFYLAQKDPQGNLTKGITITETEKTLSATNTIKDEVWWDNTKYLNIWIVRGIESGAGGWSHFPCEISARYDGIVMLNNQLNDLAHECGHWLALPHPWGRSNDNNLTTNCNMDDGIEDTPNTVGQSFCSDLTRTTCTDDPSPFIGIFGDTLWTASQGQIHDNVQNIMDYAFCSIENFTEGQKEAMRETLASTTCNGRNVIWGPTNLIATGICDTCGPYDHYPTAEFIYDETEICAGTSVSFEDISYDGTPTEWLWDFGDGQTSTVQNPTHTYSTPGTYSVTLTATNSGGSTNTSKIDLITVGATSGGEVAPFVETFENGNFPTLADAGKQWTAIDGNVNVKWKITDRASATGFQSYAVHLKNMGPGYVYTLISPPIDFTNASETNLTYRYAYAPQYAGSAERLVVWASRDCGERWTKVYETAAALMNTSGTNIVGTDFVPNDDQWDKQEVSLAAFIGRPNILVKFELTSGSGNYFYIDDINVGASLVEGIEEESNVQMSVFPNPFTDDANININVVRGEDMEVSVFNVIGEQLYSNTKFYGTGKHSFKLSEMVSTKESGIYFVKIKSSTGTVTKKLVRY